MHSYSAVPSMLMVAPSGRQKEETLLLAPPPSLTVRMVTGKVAEDELVEKAVMSAGHMALAQASGLIRPSSQRINGKVTQK